MITTLLSFADVVFTATNYAAFMYFMGVALCTSIVVRKAPVNSLWVMLALIMFVGSVVHFVTILPLEGAPSTMALQAVVLMILAIGAVVNVGSAMAKLDTHDEIRAQHIGLPSSR